MAWRLSSVGYVAAKLNPTAPGAAGAPPGVAAAGAAPGVAPAGAAPWMAAARAAPGLAAAGADPWVAAAGAAPWAAARAATVADPPLPPPALTCPAMDGLEVEDGLRRGFMVNGDEEDAGDLGFPPLFDGQQLRAGRREASARAIGGGGAGDRY